jgi:hypothetical protein
VRITLDQSAPVRRGIACAIRVSATEGVFLDDPNGSTSNGTIIQQYHYNGGGLNQQWRLLGVGGVAQIDYVDNIASGKVLDDPSGLTAAP